jgi:hypothetical protein
MLSKLSSETVNRRVPLEEAVVDQKVILCQDVYWAKFSLDRVQWRAIWSSVSTVCKIVFFSVLFVVLRRSSSGNGS